MMRTRRLPAGIVAGLVLALAVPAGAIDWIDPGTDDWTDGTNWNTGLQPGPGDKTNIFNGGTAYIDTNAGAIHQSRGGVLAGVLSVPCRYIHSPFSILRLSDFEATVKTAAEFVRGAAELAQAE